MMGTISALGYSVPIRVVLIFIALVVGLALAVMFWLTIGWSVYRSVQSTRREQVKEDVQSEFLDRMFRPDPEWEEWVESLSSVERDVAESLLDEFIRELDGGDTENLRVLGEQLGIVGRSKRQLTAGGKYTRLYALTWLTLLRRPDGLEDAAFEPQSPRERGSVARLRYESDDLESPREGIAVLLDRATSQFTVFGEDTLYRVALEDPGALFERAAEEYQSWSQPLLVQVLTVCQHLTANVTVEDMSWVTVALEHRNESVREAGVRLLGNVGWRSDVRDELFLDRLLNDPSPVVRSAVYGMLARWGDEQSLETLTTALQREEDDRARLAGTNALVRQRERLPDESSPELETAWDWSSEGAAYDRAARDRGQQVSD